MTNTTTVMGQERPYEPSWIDRFKKWVENLPVRAWIFYVVSGLVLIAVQILFLGLEGGLPAVEILPVIIFNGLFTPFLLGLMHFLDKQAVAALNAMRPTLDMTAPQLDRFRYMLAHMPGRAALASGLIMLVMAVLMERLWVTPIRYAALEQLPLFTIVFHIIDKSSAFLFGVLIYHTIRQLRLVNAINAQYIRLNLFNLGPLRAFSRLTASTAVGLLVGVYGWLLINPELLADPLILGLAGFITITAVAVFAWPLVGVHRLMELEKERMLQALDQHFEAAFAQFDQGLRGGDTPLIEKLNGMIASLEIQHRKISAIPTWPWQPETARLVLSAIALPLILTILQFLAVRAFD
jgi:hypothetical protein